MKSKQHKKAGLQHVDFPNALQKVRRLSRILWVRVALIMALSILAALSAELLDPLIPRGPKDRFNEAATLPILDVLANVMLAVATFSLGVMVSSHRTMAEQTTPRIHRLLMEDTSTQSILATFIGAFAFALASMILFRAGYYSESASVIVFATTVLVVAGIIVSLVRWISQLSRIGSMDYALERAEQTAREVLAETRTWPALGGQTLSEDTSLPSKLTPVLAPDSGFLRRIDVPALQELAESHECEIFMDVMPGDLVLSGHQLARHSGDFDNDHITDCLTLAANRTYEQDPRYAIQTLRETASKALSPGINDPGTAIEVITRLERLLWDALRTEPAKDGEPRCDRVYAKKLDDDVLVDLAFRDIARDGAAFVDVLLGIASAISTLSTLCDLAPNNRIEDLRKALDQYAEAGLSTEAELETYRSRAANAL